MLQTNITYDKLEVVSRMVASSTLEIGSRNVKNNDCIAVDA
jgi:hypothetical protein